MSPRVWPHRATCPRPGCGREGVLVNQDGSLRAHRRVFYQGKSMYTGSVCFDESTRKAHTPGMVEVGP